MFGLNPFQDISLNQFRQIIYQLDMCERYPDVRSRYIDDQNIGFFRAALRSAVTSRFNEITTLNYFDSKITRFPLDNPTKEQSNILTLFNYLYQRADGSGLLVEGVRCHFVTTNYDFVIETILDNIPQLGESLVPYAYRGFTSARVFGPQNATRVHDHWLTWHLLKLNGGFEILRTGNEYELDYSQRSFQTILQRPPVLILPSREQDYTDPYFRAIFPKAVRLLRETIILVIVGYSLPADDALIRFILRQFAEEPEDGRAKFIFYIGPDANKMKRSALEGVFPSISSENVPTVVPFRGKFDQFAAECLMLINNEGENGAP